MTPQQDNQAPVPPQTDTAPQANAAPVSPTPPQQPAQQPIQQPIQTPQMSKTAKIMAEAGTAMAAVGMVTGAVNSFKGLFGKK